MSRNRTGDPPGPEEIDPTSLARALERARELAGAAGDTDADPILQTLLRPGTAPLPANPDRRDLDRPDPAADPGDSAPPGEDTDEHAALDDDAAATPPWDGD